MNKTREYLITIYLLQENAPVRGKDLANKLGVTRSTVSASLKDLEKEEYLTRLEDQSIVLTEKGNQTVQGMFDLSKGIYDLLISLGINKTTAFHDACSLELAISKDSCRALNELGRIHP